MIEPTPLSALEHRYKAAQSHHLRLHLAKQIVKAQYENGELPVTELSEELWEALSRIYVERNP